MEIGFHKKEELKFCPFCGEKENIYLEKYEHTAGERFRVICTNCMSMIDRGYDQTPYGVVEAWNTRNPIDRIVEQLEEEIKKADTRALNEADVNGHSLEYECFYGQRMAYIASKQIVKAGGKDE